MKDKNLTAIGNIVSKTADTVIATQVPGNPRVMPAEAIRNAWTGIGRKITACPEPEKAIAKALSDASPTDLICITGSLYLVGLALEHFCRTKPNRTQIYKEIKKREVFNA